jgi:hypothetical protein
MTFSLPRALAFCGLAVAVSRAPAAHANPRPLPFTYQHEQLAAGAVELEQAVDLTPIRAGNPASPELVWYGLTQFQTELEYGLTDRLELGLYLTLAPAAASGYADIPRNINGNGMKQRLRYKLAETGEWPVDVGVYGELVENEREIEIEGKLILQRRFGMMRAIANVTAEQEFYWDGNRDFVFAPSGGLTFELTPGFQPGLEWWMRAEYPEKDPPAPRPFGLGPHHYVGPALLFQFGRVWWNAAVYFRVSDRSHTLDRGESFGNIWLRTIVGVDL